MIARVLGVCEDSEEVPLRLNEAQTRLLNRPEKPVGSLVRYRICAGESGCFSWPRFVRTIEAFAICNTPGTIRDVTYEFVGPPVGNGLLGETSWPGTTLIDRGTFCAYDNISATPTVPKSIQLIATNAADVGKRVILRYYDSSGNKKYSSIDGVVQEGERLVLPAPPAYVTTSSNVMQDGLYAVTKEVTEYPVLMYQINALLVQEKLLARYEPSEQNPIYRQSFVPGFTQTPGCCGATDDCTNNKAVTALVKLQHIPVVVDNDPLVLGNLPAFKLMCLSILREEQNRFDESLAFEAKANKELDGELASYMGDGVVLTMRVQGNGLFGSGQDVGYPCVPSCCR